MTRKKLKKRVFALLAASMLVASQTGAVFAVAPGTAQETTTAVEQMTTTTAPVESETEAATEEVTEAVTTTIAPAEGETEAESETETSAQKETESETASETISQVETGTEQETTVATEQETTAAPEQETTVAPEQETTPSPEQETTVAPEQETTTAPETETTTEEGQTSVEGETTTVEGQTTVEGETTTVEGQTTVEGETTSATGETTSAVGETTSATGETTSATGETTTAAKEAQIFIDKNGEEIAVDTLIGVDYETISENYDGEENVLKVYEVSEEFGENTIMDSYIDENGNLVMVISQGTEKKENKGLTAAVAEDEDDDSPDIDGEFDDWEDIPVSYEYNWDNSQNCWNWGVWVDGECYKTEEGTYDTDVRHGMQMYTDGDNVYLNITFAREFSNGQQANGNDYQFWIDGQMAAYQVEWADGSQLSYSNVEPGVYEVDVRHRDSSISYAIADGAQAYYKVNEGNLNNQLELKIPMEEFVRQNGNIDLDNYSMVQFFTPNLMYNKISAAGSPTGSIPFAAAAFTLVPTSFVLLKKKKK